MTDRERDPRPALAACVGQLNLAQAEALAVTLNALLTGNLLADDLQLFAADANRNAMTAGTHPVSQNRGGGLAQVEQWLADQWDADATFEVDMDAPPGVQRTVAVLRELIHQCSMVAEVEPDTVSVAARIVRLDRLAEVLGLLAEIAEELRRNHN